MTRETVTPCEETVRARLLSMRDEGYGAFTASLMPTVPRSRVLGVRTPRLRQYAKELLRAQKAGDDTAAAFMARLPHGYFEEDQLHAFLIEGISDFHRAVDALEAFLPYVDNWATCDQMAPKVLATRKDALHERIQIWMASDHPYTVRYGIGMLMRHYLDEDFDPAYLAAVAAVRSEHYYVRMMAAWYFATALAKQYEAALPYFTDGALDAWVHNKAIQKARESYRVPDRHKAYLKTLKK